MKFKDVSVQGTKYIVADGHWWVCNVDASSPRGEAQIHSYALSLHQKEAIVMNGTIARALKEAMKGNGEIYMIWTECKKLEE